MPSPDELLGEREDLLDALLGEDRATGGDAPDDRDVRRGGAGVAGTGLVDLVEAGDGHRPGPVGVALR